MCDLFIGRLIFQVFKNRRETLEDSSMRLSPRQYDYLHGNMIIYTAIWLSTRQYMPNYDYYFEFYLINGSLQTKNNASQNLMQRKGNTCKEVKQVQK